MADGVVQVAGDPRSLLGRCEPAPPLEPLTAQADAVACDQRHRPDEHAEENRRGRERAFADSDRRDVSDEQRADDCDRTARRAGRRRGKEEERDRRPDGRARRVVEKVERRARQRRRHEDGERPAAPDGERQR